MDSAGPGLFPPIEPFDSGMLAVGDGHQLYWEQSGRPDGTPVVFLHGGPGAGCAPTHRRFFDPAFYRIVLFDQRGAGKSTPSGELAANTTAHLVEDLEPCAATSASAAGWCSAVLGQRLALAYAQVHPQVCRGLILRGIFLGSDAEVDWFMYGIGRFYPEAYRAFVEAIPALERDDLLHVPPADRAGPRHPPRRGAGLEPLRRRLLDAVAEPGHRAQLLRDRFRRAAGADRGRTTSSTGCSLEPARCLARVEAIRHLPAVIVQGRYDMVCPIATADQLHRAWPEATYDVVADAGHAALEPGIRRALINASERFKRLG
ncbi:MAG: alpha/beta fold hydrolase [Alphaproteobacteria bacterium]